MADNSITDYSSTDHSLTDHSITDLQWLSAPEEQVEAAVTGEGGYPRPRRMRSRPRVLITHVSAYLMAWYLAVVWAAFGGLAEEQDGLAAGEVAGLVVAMVIFAGWGLGTARLLTWADQPTREARMKHWRSQLTASANGFESEPSRRVTFSSLIGGERRRASTYPRFVAPGIEFGNLQGRGGYLREWHYLMVRLPVPQPHLILDAIANGPLPREFHRPEADQQILRGGSFERSFRVYAPRAYQIDALFLLTPDVMAALLDDAPGFDLEIRDDALLFFTPSPADFSEPESWRRIDQLLRGAVPRLLTRARHYRDQYASPAEAEPSPREAAYQAALEELGSHWVKAPTIGPVGKRLQMRDPGLTWSKIGYVLRVVVIACLYILPLSVALAGLFHVFGAQ